MINKILACMLLAVAPLWGIAAGPIGTLGATSTITVAGRQLVDINNLIILVAHVDGAAAYSPFVAAKSGATTAYQVPAGKTFQAVAITAQATAANAFGIVSSTAACGLNDGGAPVGVVYEHTGSVSTAMSTPYLLATTLERHLVTNFTAPASTRICITQTAAVTMNATLYGYLY